jgi:hypothetical protein
MLVCAVEVGGARFDRHAGVQEEVLGIAMGKYLKTQQLLEEAERRAERVDKSVTLTRHSTSSGGLGGGRSGQRAVSVSRETTRIVRV